MTCKFYEGVVCMACDDEEGCTMAKPSSMNTYTEKQVLKAIYESGLHQYAPRVIRVQCKDGIDIDIPHSSLMNFVRKLTEGDKP